MAEWLILLVPGLPLLAALLIGAGHFAGVNRGEHGERQTIWITTLGSGTAWLVLLLLARDASIPAHISINWLNVAGFALLLQFTLDQMAQAVALLFGGLLLLSMRFAVAYMHREAGFQRFYLVLNLFMSGIYLIILSGNILVAFAGWELAGISSYLLIAYMYQRDTASGNATRVFITNRLGDAGFMLALSLALVWMAGSDWQTLNDPDSPLEHEQLFIIIAGLALAAVIKSAQFPFCAWITRALEGPTPSSAIFYGGVMVHVGVYLLLRLSPALQQLPNLSSLLVIVGGLSVLYGYFTALVQTDVKSALIFSTIMHVGLMFIAIGLGWDTLALWYLLAHSSWRTYQFLLAPSFMHLINDVARPVPRLLQRARALYTACLQRFWLDPATDAMITRPVQALAKDMRAFDETIVNRLVGLPAQENATTSLTAYEQQQRGEQQVAAYRDSAGIVIRALGWLADILHWFEEHLILRSGGEGLMRVLQRVGLWFAKIDMLLSQPRYLWLILLITLILSL